MWTNRSNQHRITNILLPLAVITLFIGGGASACGSPGGGGSQAPAATSSGAVLATSNPGTRPATKNPGVGDAARDGKFEFTVTSVQSGVASVGNSYIGKTAQGQFILVHVTVKNIGNVSQSLDSSVQKLFDNQSREFSADAAAGVYIPNSQSFLNDINPGNSVQAIIVFDIPKEVKPAKIELHDSIFSGGVTVTLA